MSRRSGVHGDRELIANLRRVRSGMAGPSLDTVCKQALEPLHEEAVANAKALRQPGSPVGGHLDEGIVVRKISARGRFNRVFWVGLTKRARRIGHLVEFGTHPHSVARGANRRRNILQKMPPLHPGATAQPFFRTAFETEKHHVMARWANRAWGIMAQIAARRARTR